MNTDKANQTLIKIAEEFASKDTIPEYMAASLIRAPEIPCSSWSWGNQNLMQMGGRTDDARGFHQWNKAGRHVKKGAKARYILAPITVTKKKDDEEDRKITVGFRCVPVFAVEDTEGQPLPEYEPAMVPPLVSLADISYRNARHGEGGSFSPDTKAITLCSEDPAVYLHELMHKYDDKTHKVKGGQDPEQEIVAELGACVLARLYGVDRPASHMAYIASYAGARTPAEVGAACLRMAERTMTAIKLILADAAKAA